MEDNFQDYLTETKRLLKDYLEARLELTRLQAAEKLSKALGLFFTLILAFLLFFFVIVFLGMVLAHWISELSGSMTIGFSVTTLVFVALLVIVLLFRKKIIEKPLANLLLRELTREEVEEEVVTRGPGTENNGDIK